MTPGTKVCLTGTPCDHLDHVDLRMSTKLSKLIKGAVRPITTYYSTHTLPESNINLIRLTASKIKSSHGLSGNPRFAILERSLLVALCGHWGLGTS